LESVQPSRFADGEAMLLAGLRREHTYAGAVRTIPLQWRDFRAMGSLPGRRGAVTYGVICGSAPERETFEYMSGMEVAGFDGLPEGVGRMRVPAVRYAVFVHETGAATLSAKWEAIFNGWLPRSGFVSAETPDFERYDDRFDPETGTGEIEIWVGVQDGGGAR